jgi:hypothetical protein
MACAADLAALHDALGCAMTAVLQTWRGDRDSASLALIEAHAAAEEAFGGESAEFKALSVVFAAIAQTANRPTAVFAHHDRPRTDPA